MTHSATIHTLPVKERLPETEYFQIERRDIDMTGRPHNYFVVQPKREKTKTSRAMVPYPPAYADSLDDLMPFLLETERVYSECRSNLEEDARNLGQRKDAARSE